VPVLGVCAQLLRLGGRTEGEVALYPGIKRPRSSVTFQACTLLPLLLGSPRFPAGFLLRRALVSPARARSDPGSRMGQW
jgi:hypothetical protein